MTGLTSPPGFVVDALETGYGARPVLDGIDLCIEPGGVTALVGANGSGKSTLLKSLARLLKPARGSVRLDGTMIAQLPTREVARRLAVLPQSPSAPVGLTVRELVEQGRFPHAGAVGMLRRQDHEAVREAMALTGTLPFADRALDTLSGGERQRAWIALALAQATPWLLLDEPTTFLDIGHQFEVLDLVERLNRERGITVVLVLHDLNQAARFADRMIVLQGGRVRADGPPGAVLTATMLAEVFAMEARVVPDPETGKPFMIPLRHRPYGQPDERTATAVGGRDAAGPPGARPQLAPHRSAAC